MGWADAIFEDRRLASNYDCLDADRSDLDAYVALFDEFSARSVLDIGCGTGTFACLLAGRGVRVIGVDPARASLVVTRAKPGADGVQWILGDVTGLPPLCVDMATMTGNVAQVFLTDDEWGETLRCVHAAWATGLRDPESGSGFESRASMRLLIAWIVSRRRREAEVARWL